MDTIAGTATRTSGPIARFVPVVRPKFRRFCTRPLWLGLQINVSAVSRVIPVPAGAAVKGAVTR